MHTDVQIYLGKLVGGVRATSIRAIAKPILGPLIIHICEPHKESSFCIVFELPSLQEIEDVERERSQAIISQKVCA
jgi:hypothetical protein